MKKNRIVFIIAFITSLTFAQVNLEEQFAIADRLFSNEKYYDAITEFKRLQFFDQNDKYEFEANYKIGLAYKKGGFYANALEYFSKAKLFTNNSDELAELDFHIVRTNILRKTTIRALQILEEFEADSTKVRFQSDVHYWRGWAYMISDEWELASASFRHISEDFELKLLCDQVKNDKYSVTFARVISYILPGAGQIYTGNYFSGFMSFSWNILWGFLTINSFIEDRAFDGVAIGSLLWLRFYRGNVQNAGKLAELKNIQIANKALSFLMENYRGEKP